MKEYQNLLITAAAVLGLAGGSVFAEPSKNFKVFLCFGQSNMSGGAGCTPDAESKKTNPRIKVLAFQNCSSPTRTNNTWSDASEPMHCGDGQNQMGPSYAFGQLLADSLKDDTIGLVPCGLWGVSIEMFMKGKTNTSSNAPSGWGNNAWDKMLAKCKIAVERGVFSGIILHQGESNSGQADWPTKVKTIYDDLKKELNIKDDFPLVAGELLYSGLCKGHNTIVAKIPATLPLGYVASAEGLTAGGSQPNYHFSTDSYRKMGQRMAVEMLKGLAEAAKVNNKQQRIIPAAKTAASISGASLVYTLNGKCLGEYSKLSQSVHNKMKCGNIYIVNTPGAAANVMVGP